jgi:photosystem II stability/assembly factor-like uncharacterized protein
MEVRGSPRARRAIALIAIALTGLAAGVAAYLWSSLPRPYYQGPPPPATSRPIPVSMDWRSPVLGWIIVHDSGSPASFVFHTEDGGAHWQRQLAVNGPASVRFTDERHGTVLVGALRGGGVTVLRTEDGGAHWLPVARPELEPGTALSTVLLDGRAGYALTRSDGYRTDDAGMHWERLAGPWAAGDDLLDVAFRADGSAWLAGAALFRTRDRGLDWAREALPAGPPGPAAADQLEIRAPTVGADGRGVLPVYDRDGDQTWLYVTEDGGATWRDPVPLPGGAGPRRPAFVDGRTGWTAALATAWSTGDGGRTWQAVAAPPGGWQFGTVVPVSGSIAWADAVRTDRPADQPADWALFRTADAGLHWTRRELPDLG